MVGPFWRRLAPRRRARRRRLPRSSWPVSATTTICGRSPMAPTASWPGWPQARSWSTTPPRRPMSPASCSRPAGSRARTSSTRPVSGGQAGAENGTLTIMCGGEPDPFARAEPVLRAYGRAVTLMGPAGAGQLTKMVNQICIGGLLQALAEGVDFAARAGLDPDQVLATISKGAAQSWQMDNRWPTMAAGKFDFGFAVDWMRKDLVDRARRGPAQRRGAAGHGAGRPVLSAGAAARRRPPRYLEPDHQPASGVTNRCPHYTSGTKGGVGCRCNLRNRPADPHM